MINQKNYEFAPLFKEENDFFRAEDCEEELGIQESLFATSEDLHLVDSTNSLAAELHHSPIESDSAYNLLTKHAPVGISILRNQLQLTCLSTEQLINNRRQVRPLYN